jgi:phosphate transport system substrate-binding protein
MLAGGKNSLWLILANLLLVGCLAASQCNLAPVVDEQQPVLQPSEDEDTLRGKDLEDEQLPPINMAGQLRPNQIQIMGASSSQSLVVALAEGFLLLNPNMVVTVRGSDSSVGIDAAGKGTVDIGLTNRRLTESEADEFPNLLGINIAYDIVAIVAHPDVSISDLSLEEVRAIFAGEITNFKEVGGDDASIVLMSRESGSSSRDVFEQTVMEYDEDGVTKRKDISGEAITDTWDSRLHVNLLNTPNSIGFLPLYHLNHEFVETESSRGLKIIKIDGVAPSVENAAGGTYPLIRPYMLLINVEDIENPELTSRVQAFLDYVLGADGHNIILKAGLLPWPDREAPPSEETESGVTPQSPPTESNETW